MQFDVFPVRGVPQELLLDGGGDVQTFVALMRADPAMRRTLLPLTPEMVKLVYPEPVLVMAMACERELIPRLRTSTASVCRVELRTGYLPAAMGLLPYMVNSWNNPARWRSTWREISENRLQSEGYRRCTLLSIPSRLRPGSFSSPFRRQCSVASRARGALSARARMRRTGSEARPGHTDSCCPAPMCAAFSRGRDSHLR